jgi:hypothetical protein
MGNLDQSFSLLKFWSSCFRLFPSTRGHGQNLYDLVQIIMPLFRFTIKLILKNLILHQPGIEPGSVPWQGTILPLDHWCFLLWSRIRLLKIQLKYPYHWLIQDLNEVLLPAVIGQGNIRWPSGALPCLGRKPFLISHTIEIAIFRPLLFWHGINCSKWIPRMKRNKIYE